MADPVPPERREVSIDNEHLLYSIGKAHAELDMRERIEGVLNQQIAELNNEIARLRGQLEATENKQVAADVRAARPKRSHGR